MVLYGYCIEKLQGLLLAKLLAKLVSFMLLEPSNSINLDTVSEIKYAIFIMFYIFIIHVIFIFITCLYFNLKLLPFPL